MILTDFPVFWFIPRDHMKNSDELIVEHTDSQRLDMTTENGMP
jgi:hypothetical protein